ncbi:polyamine ABC transporter substrate-binding protein, partial [Mesorhizobium sp. M00.F.Ca.ET.158.01.1.1]
MKTLTRRLTLTLALAGTLAASAAALAIAADKDLIVFDWSGYEDPGFHPKYVEKNGDSPTFAKFGKE